MDIKPIAKSTAGELQVRLHPRQDDTWLGTAEQLTEEGLIPHGFKWPERTKTRSFTHNGIECSLQRKPLPGGPRGQPWVGVDNWLLVRYCANRGNGGAAVYEKEQALRHERWKWSEEGRQMFNRAWKAHSDASFQEFKRRLVTS